MPGSTLMKAGTGWGPLRPSVSCSLGPFMALLQKAQVMAQRWQVGGSRSHWLAVQASALLAKCWLSQGTLVLLKLRCGRRSG